MSTYYESLEVRSHLAANTFLTRIAQSVRPNQSFTYIEIASAFHLPVRYVSKMLSRLAKRRLLTARRIPRFDRFGVHRGFLNVYSMSGRGWGKVRYLLGSSFSSSGVGKEDLLGLGRAEVEENFGLTYLVNGKGTIEEYAGLGIPVETLLNCPPPAKARKANVGAIMIGLNGRCVSAEMGSIFLKHTPYLKDLELWPRLSALCRLRLTPTDVNTLGYAMGARYLGRTDEEIVIALLAR